MISRIKSMKTNNLPVIGSFGVFGLEEFIGWRGEFELLVSEGRIEGSDWSVLLDVDFFSVELDGFEEKYRCPLGGKKF